MTDLTRDSALHAVSTAYPPGEVTKSWHVAPRSRGVWFAVLIDSTNGKPCVGPQIVVAPDGRVIVFDSDRLVHDPDAIVEVVREDYEKGSRSSTEALVAEVQ